ncbi:YcnI family copper-binding membrane protein [Pedococcus soli]
MNHFPARLRARTTTVVLGGLAAVSLSAGPAAAHVRVEPDSTVSGSYSGLTFRVPNESDTASTTKVVLTLPRDTPFRHVSVRPVPGWTAAVTEAPLPTPVTLDGSTLTKAARTVTWTAGGGQAIAPGQYQEFAISAGPLPAPGTLVLPVTQTYSDGEVVDWATAQAPGQEEPEHPAPQFEVTAATAGGTAGVSAGAGDVRAAHAEQTSGDEGDLVSRLLAGGALLVALAALAGQVLARRRREVFA